MQGRLNDTKNWIARSKVHLIGVWKGREWKNGKAIIQRDLPRIDKIYKSFLNSTKEKILKAIGKKGKKKKKTNYLGKSIYILPPVGVPEDSGMVCPWQFRILYKDKYHLGLMETFSHKEESRVFYYGSDFTS